MNDPHVVALIYRVLHADGTDYNRAEALDRTYPGFLVKIDNGLARFEMNDHFATEEEAREFIKPFIEEWQAKADLERSPGEFRLEFVSAEIDDRDSQPGVLHATGGSYKFSGVSASLSAARGTYPPPPEWPAAVAGGVGSQQLPSITQEGRGPAAVAGGVGSQQLPSLTQEGRGVVGHTPITAISNGARRVKLEPDRRAELGTLIQSAREALAKVREALDDPATAHELDAHFATPPGIGHNRPPPNLDELKAVVEEGEETLGAQELRFGWLRTLLAALRPYGKIFAEMATKSAAGAFGLGVGALLVGLLDEALSALDMLRIAIEAFFF